MFKHLTNGKFSYIEVMFTAFVYVMSKILVSMFTGLGHVIISNTGAMSRHLTMVCSGRMGSWSLNIAISCLSYQWLGFEDSEHGKPWTSMLMP